MNQPVFSFRQLEPGHLPDLLAIQEEAFTELDNPRLLRRNDSSSLAACLEPPHVTLGAFSDDTLAAFAVLYFGGEGPENLGVDLELDPDELSSAANVKLIIVRPRFRGCSLQKRLCRRLEEIALERGVRVLCSTVDPENIHSARNLLSVGYRLSHRVEKYGGLPRDLYYKQLVPNATPLDRLYLSVHELLENKSPPEDLLQAAADLAGLELNCRLPALESCWDGCSYQKLVTGDIAVYRKKNQWMTGIVLGRMTRQLFYRDDETGEARIAPMDRKLAGWKFDRGISLQELYRCDQ